MASFCLAPVALIACLWSVADCVARSWFMQAVDLHDLMGPRYDNADLQMAMWAAETEARDANGEAEGQAASGRGAQGRPERDPGTPQRQAEMGRASCRERACQYGEIQGDAVSLKKTKQE